MRPRVVAGGCSSGVGAAILLARKSQKAKSRVCDTCPVGDT